MFSQTGEYALRAAGYVAQHGGDGPVLAKNISEHMQVPLKYLQKVLRVLVRSKVLTSTRGIGGGFRLVKPASKVSVADVIDAFEDIPALMKCPFGRTQCGGKKPCPLHTRWEKVAGACSDFLENTTLADITWPSQ